MLRNPNFSYFPNHQQLPRATPGSLLVQHFPWKIHKRFPDEDEYKKVAGSFKLEAADLASCNMFTSSGWGFEYSAPGPNALFLSFVATYLIFGMAAHSNFNWVLLGSLLIIVAVNAFFRVKLLNCGEPIDILFGWAFGIIGAVIWYGMMAAAESASQGTMSLTYFGDESGVNQCKITNKKFKCKKL